MYPISRMHEYVLFTMPCSVPECVTQTSLKEDFNSFGRSEALLCSGHY